MSTHKPTFYEFFAGGGMARAGLGDLWECVFANDFSPAKASSYVENWGSEHFHLGDIAAISASSLPGQAALSWASFPCQDLSLAGAYAGLGDSVSSVRTRSGTFWHFWSLMQELCRAGRPPRTIVLENVYGALTSRGGADFAAICDALAAGGYRYGSVVVDAVRFVPQSRPRVFFVAVHRNHRIPDQLTRTDASEWHPPALQKAQALLRGPAIENWVWWHLPTPPKRPHELVDIIEENPTDVRWHTREETQSLLAIMTELNRLKVEAAKSKKLRVVGTIYRRTRADVTGVKRQRAEVRFDGIAGCLRTPAGGSSRQTLIIVEDGDVRTRLLSSREAARLMGLPDSYRLPTRYNEAYHLAGDGVCVAAVRFLSEELIGPLSGAVGSVQTIAAE